MIALATRFAVMLAALLLATPAPAAEPGTLRVAIQGDLRILDPVWSPIVITQMFAQMTYDTLFALDDKLQPQPQMVETYSVSEDGLVYRFTLRPGLRFHDGAPVAARDAVASIRRWAARAGDGQVMMTRLETLVADDDRSFTLRLNKPFGLLLQSLANGSSTTMVVMPERDAATDPFTAVTSANGSGPYVFDRAAWVPGSRVVFRRNPAYIPRAEPASGLAGGKIARMDRVEWLYIPDQSTAAAALRTGEVDVFDLVPYDLIPQLRASRGVTVALLDRIGFQAFIRTNALFPPFNDPRARQALFHLVKPVDILAAMVADPAFATECMSAFVCGAPGAPPPRAPAYDPARARQLLQDAGYRGEKLVLLDPTDLPASSAMAQVMAQELRQIGANVDLQAMDWSSVNIRRVSRANPATDRTGWNIFFTYRPGLTAQNPIINNNLATQCDGRNAFGWPCDADFEALRTSYVDAATPADQAQIMQALQDRFFTVAPYTPVGQFTRPIAHRDTVKGLLPAQVLVFWNVGKTE